MPKACRTTINKKITALAWILKHVEYHGKILERSKVVEGAVVEQQVSHRLFCNKNNAGVDPHKGIKDIMSNDELVSIACAIYSLDNVQILESRMESVAFTWTWGKNAGITWF
jgi:hypothetical protein